MSTLALDRPQNLLQSFGVSAGIIVVGVLATWVYLQRSGEQVTLQLPEIALMEEATLERLVAGSTSSWVISGEEAYAAGRVIEPPADNALYYFEKALEDVPGHPDALAGIERVSQYLLSSIDSAIFRSDWAEARKLISEFRALNPGNAEARLLSARVDRFEQVEVLIAQADAQLSSSRLTAPTGNNALETYREILEIDPSNSIAARGVELIVRRLLDIAQSAALAGEQDKARDFLNRVKRIDPDAAGLAQAEERLAQWSEMVTNQNIKQRLEQASAALQAGNLVGARTDALALFNSVLELDPGSEAALQGKRLVLGSLADRAWSEVRSGRFDAADDSIELARSAGVDAGEVDSLEKELEYQRSLARARRGEFDSVLSISELEVRRREVPVYPPRALGNGWVALRFTVSETGEVVDASVHESSSAMFEGSAIAAINRWRFKPYTVDGRPIPVRSAIRFAFEE